MSTGNHTTCFNAQCTKTPVTLRLNNKNNERGVWVGIDPSIKINKKEKAMVRACNAYLSTSIIVEFEVSTVSSRSTKVTSSTVRTRGCDNAKLLAQHHDIHS
mmetsp:Transcript_11397/g.32827  ORF Transcript_11397/g.32827 Transcript_11397/m.32827 type:complete len:102 (-) Transcript_11397:99-404(-)